MGNPDLRNETSINTDLALRVQSGRVSMELGGFANYINNYIYFRPTGTFDSPSGRPEVPCSDPDNFSCFQKFQAVQEMPGLPASSSQWNTIRRRICT